jgi:small subunit ribosomal protein S6
MRHYETVVILPPNLGEAPIEEVVTTVEKELTDRFGAQAVTVNRWGRQTLAYPIKKFKEGYYVLYEFDSDRDDTISGLEARLRINESIIRFLTVRRDEEKRTAERLAARIAKRKKQEAGNSGVLGSYDEDMDLE